VHRFLPRPEDAEDVAQEVFLKMYRSLSTYRSDAPFEHWLLRIASNACRDQLRERRRRPSTPLAELTDDAASWLDSALAGGSLAAAEADTARLAAAELLDRLPVNDRMVLVWMDVEGRSSNEIAAILGSTRAAVKIRAFRARRALRRLAGGVAGKPR
jgi:RNA polymerase sigma-70 factor (ECF subfamily)